MKTLRGKVVCLNENCHINPDAVVRISVWGVDTEDEVKTVASVYPTGIKEFPFEFSIDVDESLLSNLLINSICLDVTIETRGAVDFKPSDANTIAHQQNDGSVRITDFVNVALAPFRRI